MRTLIAVSSVLAAVTPAARAQDITGVWKPVEVFVGAGVDSGSHVSQPGLVIYTKSYFASVRLQGLAPRPVVQGTPSDHQRVMMWQPFVAFAGTYTIHDSLLSITPSVAKNPDEMAGRALTFKVRVVADSMWVYFGEAGVGRWVKSVRIERLPT